MEELPDVRDGLTRTERTALAATHALVPPPGRSTKSLTVVQHAASLAPDLDPDAVYAAMVRLAQDHVSRHPLLEGQGNFGSIDDDPAAEPLHTELRLSRLATDALEGVDWDGSPDTPIDWSLPPLLVNSPLPHRLGDLAAALQARLSHPDGGLAPVLSALQGPDLPAGATVWTGVDLRSVYESGEGAVTVDGDAAVARSAGRPPEVRITALPLGVAKGGDHGLIREIVDLVSSGRVDQISDVFDESDRAGMNLVVELKRDADPETVLTRLRTDTVLRRRIPVMLACSDDGTRRVVPLLDILDGHAKRGGDPERLADLGRRHDGPRRSRLCAGNG